MSLTLPAFSGYGIELEYMIVDRRTLSILPIAEKVLQRISETCASGLRRGELAWSHELVLQFSAMHPWMNPRSRHRYGSVRTRKFTPHRPDFTAIGMLGHRDGCACRDHARLPPQCGGGGNHQCRVSAAAGLSGSPMRCGELWRHLIGSIAWNQSEQRDRSAHRYRLCWIMVRLHAESNMPCGPSAVKSVWWTCTRNYAIASKRARCFWDWISAHSFC